MPVRFRTSSRDADRASGSSDRSSTAQSQARSSAPLAARGGRGGVRSVVSGSGDGVASPAAALGVQPKLQINAPGDRYEQEADAVAGAVSSGAPAPAISKLPPGGLATEGGTAQRQAQDEEPVQMQAEEDEPVQMQAEEEEPVQMQAEEEEPVQMQAEEEEPVQMQELEDEKPAQRQELEDEEPAQKREASGGAGRSAGASAAASAMTQAGAGSPLPSPVRSRIEGSTGRDFSGVRVHEGGAAQRAAEAINARAFTRGNDIYLGRGASPTDTQLMAHEATHVVQQSAAPPATSSAQRQPAQRDIAQRQETEDEPVQMQATEEPVQRAEDDDDGGAEASSVTPSPDGTREGNRLRVHFSSINIPPFKKEVDHRGDLYDSHLPVWRHRGYIRGNNTNQRKVWMDTVNTGGIEEKVQEKINSATEGYKSKFGSSYLFKTPMTGGYVAGSNKAEIAKKLLIPTWGQTDRGTTGELVPRVGGRNEIFHVDHIVELQLAGWHDPKGGPRWANKKENMELLLGSKNLASGPKIEKNIERKAKAYAQAVENPRSVYKDYKRVLAGLNLYFHRVESGGAIGVSKQDYWSRDEIEAGAHLEHPKALKLDTARKIGEDGNVLVLSSASGPYGKQFPVEGSLDSTQKKWLDPFVITNAAFHTDSESAEDPGVLGTFTVKVPEGKEGLKAHAGEEVNLQVSRLGAADYVGHFEKDNVEDLVEAKFNITGGSPIRVNYLQVDPESGLLVSAQLLPTVPLIGDADIEVLVSGGEITISKTFGIGDYNFPGPVEVTQSSITMSYSSNRGIALDGRADLEVEDVGTGYLEGGASTEAGFHVAGGFDFDTELFSEASIDLGYHKPPDEEAVFSGSGTLSIGRHKVKGIKSASIDVTVENESWTADGTVEPEIKGVEQGDLSAAYDPEKGFAIAGRLQLSQDVPGIRGGTLEAGVQKRESGEGYKIMASGEADLDIPGVSSKIGVTYDDGLFTARTTVGYERGMLSGRLTVGVTNQPLGDDGQPAGGEDAGDPGADLRAFGGGEMTLGLAPWLQATAGVQLLPNGEVEMRGEIGIPDVIELFPQRRYEKRLFQIGIDIPIVGVAVAGQRIGIFATVNGGLDATASIGPGELRDANLAVQYNPDREEETTVTGHALFVIPAFAGLRLFVRGGLGAGIPIVSAEAGLEVGGQIGLEGSAEAEADVNWNPQAGLALHAEGRIFAEPSFLFDVSGYANVSADLLFTSIDLYDERFTLASYEWGSGMRVGVIFPVDYREGEPFSLSTDDLRFVYPRINPRAMISDIVDEAV